MDSRLGDRNDYTLTDLPICNECGTNTRSNGWVNRVPSDFDICGKRQAEGQEADRSDVLNIETYKCGTCIGDWAEEILDEDTGEYWTDWDAVDKEIQENWIPEVDAEQPLAKKWRMIFDFADCGYGHADIEDIRKLWKEAQDTNNGQDLT